MIFKKSLSKKKLISALAVSLIVVLLCVVVFWQGLNTVTYTLTSDKIDSDIRICVITDHHSSSYGKRQKKLLSEIEKASPDVIMIVGDLFDEARDTDNAEDLLEAIGEKYTCFYVTGNHEYRNDTEKLKALVRSYGITVLEGDIVELTVNGQNVSICGVDDLFGFGEYYDSAQTAFDECISECYEKINKDDLTFLMTHRPQHADIYSKYGFDIVVSGHSHGGQVRIPYLINGLYTPTDGFFPDYAGGVYSLSERTKLVVSRGLCKDEIPRVFNPPELVFVDIIPEK